MKYFSFDILSDSKLLFKIFKNNRNVFLSTNLKMILWNVFQSIIYNFQKLSEIFLFQYFNEITMNVIFSIILMIILWIGFQNCYCVIKVIKILSIFSLSFEKKIIDHHNIESTTMEVLKVILRNHFQSCRRG